MRTWTPVIAAFVLLTAFAAAQQPKPADPLAGTVKKHIYRNDYFAFAVEIPKAWKADLEAEPEVIRDPAQRAKAVERWNQLRKQQHLLFSAMPIPDGMLSLPLIPMTGTPGTGGTANVLPVDQFIYVRAVPVEGEPAAARDKQIALLRARATQLTVDETPAIFDRVAFVRVTQMAEGVNHRKLYGIAYLAIRNGHILIFDCRGKKEKQLNELATKFMATLRFEASSPQPAN